ITVNNVSEKIPLIFDVAQNNDIKIREVRYTRPTLDDVFLRLTGRKLRDEKGSWVDIARMRRQIRMARRR
ncbi:MAG: ABC transporter ATP-binding protein, partial [Candidatus Njordarchaeales archaeon]